MIDVPFVARFLAGLTCSYRLTGAELLPRTGPALVVVNHTTIADVPVVLAALDRHGLKPISEDARGHSAACADHLHVRFLATQNVFDHPLLGRVVRRAGFIAVQPAGLGRVDAYAAADEALRAGQVVALYPEGDVTSPEEGAPRRLRSGAARLAIATGVPIVPVAHHDAREIGAGTEAQTLRRAVTSILRRPTVQLVVGRTIQPHEYAGLTPLELTRMIREHLTETWRRAVELRAGDVQTAQPS